MTTFVRVGFSPVAVECFHEAAIEEIDALRSSQPFGIDSILEILSDDIRAKYLITFLRLACSAHLRANCEEFMPFLPEPYAAVDRFCDDEVEPCDREADQIQSQALAAMFNVSIRILMIDLSAGDACNEHILGQGEPIVTLLYRPGHYDVVV